MIVKDSFLPANAPTFRAGMSISPVEYLDSCLYTCSVFEAGSFSEVIAVRETS